MIVLVLLYTIALVCFVASNNASSGRSKNAMVCGIVAVDMSLGTLEPVRVFDDTGFSEKGLRR